MVLFYNRAIPYDQAASVTDGSVAGPFRQREWKARGTLDMSRGLFLSEETRMQKNYQKLGYIEGILSSIINTLLFVIKFWAGMSIGSIAMIADAWHTLSDTLTSMVVIVGYEYCSSRRSPEVYIIADYCFFHLNCS